MKIIKLTRLITLNETIKVSSVDCNRFDLEESISRYFNQNSDGLLTNDQGKNLKQDLFAFCPCHALHFLYCPVAVKVN